MQTLNPRDFSALTILNVFSVYLLARLRADLRLAGAARAARRCHDRLDSALQAFWAAQQGMMNSASLRDSAGYGLDGALRFLRVAVLVYAHNDRRSKIYTALFGDGFAKLIRRNPVKKLVQARRILAQVAEFPDPVLAHAVEALRNAIDVCSAAVTGYAAAERARQEAAGALEAAKQAYCARYEKIYHQAVMILGERRQADTFFRRVRRRRRAEEAETSLRLEDSANALVVPGFLRSGGAAQAG